MKLNTIYVEPEFDVLRDPIDLAGGVQHFGDAEAFASHPRNGRYPFHRPVWRAMQTELLSK